jgi:hypothetical protein
MLDCKSMATPMVSNLKKLSESSFDSDLIDMNMYIQPIGSLMYLVNTTPYSCYAMSELIQFMSHPRHMNWVEAKHVLRYLRGTVGYGIRYAFNIDMRLNGYADSDWAGSIVDRNSASGCCFSLGSAMVSLCRKKQTFVALSIIKVDYIAICVAVHEEMCLRKLIIGLFG